MTAIKPADRVSAVQEYYFSRKLKEVAKLNAEGKDIISLAIGSPDMPPSKQTVEKLCEVAAQPNAHGYQPTMGTPELRHAMANFYKRWYDVDLNADTEVQPLIGSKEGILHVTLAFVNPGEKVLVPNPGYPTYTSLSKILGAEIINYNLREDNGWQPDFDELEKMDLTDVKLMWTNYPNMPTGGNARRETYERLVAFAKKHGIVVVNDNPYSFILNDKPMSLLQVPGAKRLLHRVQLNVEEPQHAGLACGHVRLQPHVHIVDLEDKEQYRLGHVPRSTARCRRGVQHQHTRMAPRGKHHDLPSSPRHRRTDHGHARLLVRPLTGGHVPMGTHT